MWIDPNGHIIDRRRPTENANSNDWTSVTVLAADTFYNLHHHLQSNASLKMSNILKVNTQFQTSLFSAQQVWLAVHRSHFVTHTHTHMPAHTHTCTHTHARAHTHTHTHTFIAGPTFTQWWSYPFTRYDRPLSQSQPKNTKATLASLCVTFTIRELRIFNRFLPQDKLRTQTLIEDLLTQSLPYRT